MKKKIIIGLGIFSGIVFLTTAYTVLTVERSTSIMAGIFSLHDTEMRSHHVGDEELFGEGKHRNSASNLITEKAEPMLRERLRGAAIETKRMKSALYIAAAIMTFSAIGLWFFFITGITRPLAELQTVARRFKNGELSCCVDGFRDEFGEVAASFNAMADAIRHDRYRMQWAEQLVVLGEMMGGLAHEIKNPLAGIKASVDVLSRDCSLSAENRMIAVKVGEQIKRIEGLIRNILNFARPPKPQFMLVDINAVIDSTASLAQRHPAFTAAGPNVITISKDFDRSLPEISADPLQLQQVFFNLLLNSADAMREGGLIAIRTARMEDDFIAITIADSGKGIDDQIAEKIFQPFFTTKQDGTGLGLAISKGLVEQHGGSIRVQNNNVKGVTFTITIPIITVEEVCRA